MLKSTHVITITFAVNEECVPGMFYDPQDFIKVSEDVIKRTLSPYNPRDFHSSLDTLSKPYPMPSISS